MLSSVPPPPTSATPMAMPAPTGDIGIIGAERRLQTWFAYYVMALFGIISVEAGTVYGAVFVIGCTELVMSLWRPTPRFGYATTLAPTWDGPVRALRLFLLARQFASYAWGFFLTTIFLGFFIVVARPKSLGLSNLIVAGVFAVYYGTRPLWYAAVKSQVGEVLKGFNKGWPQVRVVADGLDIHQPVRVINGPPRDWDWHIGFAEIDELRAMGALDAQAYWQSMLMYDPSLGIRAAYELQQYLTGKIARPSIYQYVSAGTHLLIRGPSVLYIVPNGDQTGPAAISAWQQWRTAQSSGR